MPVAPAVTWAVPAAELVQLTLLMPAGIMSSMLALSALAVLELAIVSV